jgi:hypothetical protein
MKDLYNATKKLSGKFSKSERPVKVKQGRTIQGEEGQNRRKDHFEELLNRPAWDRRMDGRITSKSF